MQFAARFECTLDPATAAICAAIPLDDLPAERVWGEVEKLLLRGVRPSIGLTLGARRSASCRGYGPSCTRSSTARRSPTGIRKGDVWIHTLMVVDEARTRIADLDHPRQVTVMLGALVHDLGKPATTAFEDGRIRSQGHEAAGVAPATALLDRLNIHTVDGFDVRQHMPGHRRVSPRARHVEQGADTGGRRRLPSPGRESRPRAARPRRRRRLPRTRRLLRLLGDRLVPRPRPRRSACSTKRRSRF